MLLCVPSLLLGQDVRHLFQAAPRDDEIPPTFGAPFTRGDLERLHLCTKSFLKGPPEIRYRWLDVDGDGVPELVYTGWRAYENCGVGEGHITMIWRVRGDSIRRQFVGEGLVQDMAPASASGTATTIVLFASGCCGDYMNDWTTVTLRARGDSLVAETGPGILTTWMTLESRPSSWFDAPITFLVDQASYNLRYSPVVNDTAYLGNPLMQVQRHTNVLASFEKGSSGRAFATSRDKAGREWWLVMMESTDARDAVDSGVNGKTYRWLGWMSNRYLRRAE